MIAFRHPVDKFIGAGRLTCLDAFLFCGVRITPAQVVKDRSGEQCIFLKDYRNLISQDFRIIFADVHASYTDGTFIYIIQTADQVDQAALS